VLTCLHFLFNFKLGCHAAQTQDRYANHTDFMSKRNFLYELIDYRSRHNSENPILKIALRRIGTLYTSYNFINSAITNYKPDFDFHIDEKEEVLKYYPVKIVAIIQDYFKNVIRELILSGEPYKSNANKLKNELKIIKNTLLIRQEDFSDADLIAHVLNLNKFENINSYMNLLSGVQTDFFMMIKSHSLYFSYEKDETKEFHQVADEVFANLYEVFRLRNIICHEVSDDMQNYKANLKTYIVHASLFLRVVDNVIFREKMLA